MVYLAVGFVFLLLLALYIEESRIYDIRSATEEHISKHSVQKMISDGEFITEINSLKEQKKEYQTLAADLVRKVGELKQELEKVLSANADLKGALSDTQTSLASALEEVDLVERAHLELFDFLQEQQEIEEIELAPAPKKKAKVGGKSKTSKVKTAPKKEKK